ncbi:hypothetical protein AX14_010727, partial [Amanita brunnescens Koide BX004]
PARKHKKGWKIPGQFDTILVHIGAAETEGRIDAYQAAQVCVIFTITATTAGQLFSPTPVGK